MLNVSAEPAGTGAGVLSRALEVLEGVALMQLSRGTEPPTRPRAWPGRLAQALRIDRSLDGVDLCRKGPLWLGEDEVAGGRIGKSIRIGITKDAERLLRFYVLGSLFVSGTKTLNG